MNTKGKEFVVSVADFAFYINDVLACTGTTNLSSSTINHGCRTECKTVCREHRGYAYPNI